MVSFGSGGLWRYRAEVDGNVGFTFEYKGLSVSFTGLYRIGEYMYNQTLVDKVENAQLNYNVDKRAYYDAWMKEGIMYSLRVSERLEQTDSGYFSFVQKLNEFDFSALSIGYDFYRFGFVEKCGLERLQLQFNMNDIGKISSVQIERGTSYPLPGIVRLR